MNNSLAQGKAKLAAMSLQQQAIFLLISIVFIYFVWHWLLFGPAEQHKIELQNQIEGTRNKLADLRSKLKNGHPSSSWIQEFNSAQKLALQADKIIPMMRELMSKQPGLELMSITTRPPEPLKLDEVLPSRINPNRAEEAAAELKKQNAPNTSDAGNSGIFKQIITLQFHGDYFNTLQFIEKIESLPWILVHDDIVYNVTGYPQANVTMQLNLLSLAQGFK